MPYQVENVFGETIWLSLSPGYTRLMNVVVEQTLTTGGFLGLLLADEKDFVATVRVAIFTVNEGWYKSLCSMEGQDEISFNSACSYILAQRFQNLRESSTITRKYALSSYHHRLYDMVKERNLSLQNCE